MTRGGEEMNPHFFTAPFYLAFIWFRVQGSGFKVQGSGFRVQGSGLSRQVERENEMIDISHRFFVV